MVPSQAKAPSEEVTRHAGGIVLDFRKKSSYDQNKDRPIT